MLVGGGGIEPIGRGQMSLGSIQVEIWDKSFAPRAAYKNSSESGAWQAPRKGANKHVWPRALGSTDRLAGQLVGSHSFVACSGLWVILT